MDTSFFDHPVIKSIQDIPKWTVSDKDKRPVHIGKILEGRYRGEGAVEPGPPYTTELTTIRSALGIPANAAFYLDSQECGLTVLDVEPVCPDDVKAMLLDTDWIYGETSLSGRGYHLVYPLPPVITNYPAAMNKVAMKSPTKDYEFHMLHWVTFTGNQLSVPPGTRSIIPMFEDLCKIQVEGISVDFDLSEEDPGDFPYREVLSKLLKDAGFRKTPDDYHGDMSCYEFAMAVFLGGKLRNLLSCSVVLSNGHDYTDQECVWLIYQALVANLEYRPKHDQARDGLPWLLWEAANAWFKGRESRKKSNKAD